jgi:hypothetical protein
MRQAICFADTCCRLVEIQSEWSGSSRTVETATTIITDLTVVRYRSSKNSHLGLMKSLFMYRLNLPIDDSNDYHSSQRWQ